MATTNRASLLNGLRTGGVRSSFHLPANVLHEEDDLYINSNTFTEPSLQSASHRPLNPNSAPFSPAHLHTPQFAPTEAQLDAYHQMQLMQLEILRLQTAQAHRNQQVQAAVLAEALRQQARRSPLGLVAPASAGPTNTSFDVRSNTPSTRRPNQAEFLKAQLGVASLPQPDDHVPMTAALGGRFGARFPSSSVVFPSLPEAVPQSSSPPKHTTVLGAGPVRGGSPPKDNTLSRSDVATSWRRGNNSVLSGLRTTSIASPSVKITPPPEERVSPPLTPANKLRPRPLSFVNMASSNLPVVAIDSGSEHEDSMSSTSSSNPATPQSLEAAPLSPRDQATKKSHDGLNMGRPTPHIVQMPGPTVHLPQRLASQPLRQPRGPPSGADELGPKNFATRIRRKAIGGLGVLMDARERRESIEVY